MPLSARLTLSLVGTLAVGALVSDRLQRGILERQGGGAPALADVPAKSGPGRE